MTPATDAAVLQDDELLIERIFDTSHGLRALALSAIAVGLYWLGYMAQRRHPQRIFSSEAILYRTPDEAEMRLLFDPRVDQREYAGVQAEVWRILQDGLI